MSLRSIRIITPVYNDWASFRKLLTNLDLLASQTSLDISVSAVNDGSSETPHPLIDGLTLRHLKTVEIVHLKVNVGHQRAIAVGMGVAALDNDAEAVLVMDADGEDPPEAIPLLLASAGPDEIVIVVAQRARRQESLSFRLSYLMYRRFFQLLTGKTIRFGNFSLHSMAAVERLLLLPDLWNNLAAAVLRSRIPIRSVAVNRGRRYAGRSKMNYTSLVVHGFSFISAYADSIFVRLLAFSAALMAFTGVAAVALLILRFYFPALATPGWATSIVFGLSIITVQLIMTALSSLLMLLNNRVQRLTRPRDEWSGYVDRRELILKTRNKD